MRGRPDPDRIDQFVSERPEALARSALMSWAIGVALAAADLMVGSRGSLWPFLVFPLFVVTVVASAALFQRDPERAGLDALRGALLTAIPSAILVGRAAVRAIEVPIAGRIALVCMASAAIGAVIGALAGPVAGWALRSTARSARALIRGDARR